MPMPPKASRSEPTSTPTPPAPPSVEDYSEPETTAAPAARATPTRKIM